MTTPELKCTQYFTPYSDEPCTPCQCPICAGFLKWNDGKPTCTKCGADLIVIPERDEEDGTEQDYGKICPISLEKKGGIT